MHLRGRLCVLVGGGEVAARKAALLLRAGARLRVVAPDLSAALLAVADSGETGDIEHLSRAYIETDLEGAALVVAATDDRDVNRAVSEDARGRCIPVNVVDDPELCSVIVPAIIDRSPVLIAVGTGGSAPVLARLLRATIEAHVPAQYGALARLSAAMRGEVQRRLPDVLARRRFWEEVFEGEIAQCALRGETERAQELIKHSLAAVGGIAEQSVGEVYLIGAGPNDPELLSFRALRLLQRCDLVLSAPSVSRDIAELSRRDAARVALARWPPELADVVARLRLAADSGKRACVLAPGDAFRTEPGRALESATRAAGIQCVVVPAIA